MNNYFSQENYEKIFKYLEENNTFDEENKWKINK